jgi:endo-1,4-beta-D-glucanase Y
MTETRSDEKIAKDYKAMGDSVDLIQSIVTAKKNADGQLMIMRDKTDAQKKESVNINVGYIEYMRALTDWKGNEDWTDVDKAITDGKAYVG